MTEPGILKQNWMKICMRNCKPMPMKNWWLSVLAHSQLWCLWCIIIYISNYLLNNIFTWAPLIVFYHLTDEFPPQFLGVAARSPTSQWRYPYEWRITSRQPNWKGVRFFSATDWFSWTSGDGPLSDRAINLVNKTIPWFTQVKYFEEVQRDPE